MNPAPNLTTFSQSSGRFVGANSCSFGTFDSPIGPFSFFAGAINAIKRHLLRTKSINKQAMFIHTATKGFHMITKGLYMDPKGFHIAAKGLNIATKGFHTGIKGFHMVTKGFHTDIKGFPTATKDIHTAIKFIYS